MYIAVPTEEGRHYADHIEEMRLHLKVYLKRGIKKQGDITYFYLPDSVTHSPIHLRGAQCFLFRRLWEQTEVTLRSMLLANCQKGAPLEHKGPSILSLENHFANSTRCGRTTKVGPPHPRLHSLLLPRWTPPFFAASLQVRPCHLLLESPQSARTGYSRI